MPREIKYTVPEEYDGKKVVHFLRGYCGFSSRLVRSIKFTPEGMKLNGEKTRTVDRIKSGDIITVFLHDSGEAPALAKADLNIIYEDDDILVINKSPFMAMHPTHNHQGVKPLTMLSNVDCFTSLIIASLFIAIPLCLQRLRIRLT